MNTPPPLVETRRDVFAVGQLHFELKIVGIKETIEEAQELAMQIGTQGYPVLVLAVPFALIPQGHMWSVAGNR